MSRLIASAPRVGRVLGSSISIGIQRYRLCRSTCSNSVKICQDSRHLNAHLRVWFPIAKRAKSCVNEEVLATKTRKIFAPNKSWMFADLPWNGFGEDFEHTRACSSGCPVLLPSAVYSPAAKLLHGPPLIWCLKRHSCYPLESKQSLPFELTQLYLIWRCGRWSRSSGEFDPRLKLIPRKANGPKSRPDFA